MRDINDLPSEWRDPLMALGMDLTMHLDGTGFYCKEVVVMDEGHIVAFGITNGTKRRADKARVSPLRSVNYVKHEAWQAAERLIEWAKQNG